MTAGALTEFAASVVVEHADRDALAVVIARVGDLALALGDDLESLEINRSG